MASGDLPLQELAELILVAADLLSVHLLADDGLPQSLVHGVLRDDVDDEDLVLLACAVRTILSLLVLHKGERALDEDDSRRGLEVQRLAAGAHRQTERVEATGLELEAALLAVSVLDGARDECSAEAFFVDPRCSELDELPGLGEVEDLLALQLLEYLDEFVDDRGRLLHPDLAVLIQLARGGRELTKPRGTGQRVLHHHGAAVDLSDELLGP